MYLEVAARSHRSRAQSPRPPPLQMLFVNPRLWPVFLAMNQVSTALGSINLLEWLAELRDICLVALSSNPSTTKKKKRIVYNVCLPKIHVFKHVSISFLLL
jgi:hypothetical protein